ncbi:DGQHR domain-containing protein DpdB [Brevundimonas nasdae]|uniref:DGQHR domain-containing protein n=1 Tax=Brevundimonas nasdae TaxID=172043 RepID=A0ABX8TMB5_9CAUL|nr:DGQHR domain-containing protein DpdB [Brevundimonas nasdae]QYC11500.1 DGQHR domain-containing protein [Brevundimonas nasdae]QYC14288.1 DGQHR domain-containing protein [Brevundimonas nasdae]
MTQSTLTFLAARARQSANHDVLTFAATADQVLAFSEIERVGRDQDGALSGFQRPQIAGHIREIRDYLETDQAVLPNAIVVAFTGGVTLEDLDGGICRITIPTGDDAPKGLVVDGQQRLTALSTSHRRDFQLFVSLLVCRDEEELRRQFVLINNTRPLPKSLIYELLPGVDGLPDRMQSRQLAARLTERLNFNASSALRGQIYQHTNPTGVIKDTAIQKVLMNSLSDGVMRLMVQEPNGERQCFDLISEFYKAVQMAFPEAWWGHKPSSSRLIGGAGIQAMGYVMETLAQLDDARSWSDFMRGLSALEGKTAWTEGSWDFGNGDVRHWKALNVTPTDVSLLARYLEGIVRKDIRSRRAARHEAVDA